MRTGAIGLALLLAACGSPGDGDDPDGTTVNSASSRAALPDAGATLALSAEGAERCAAKWDGVAVTRAQVLERATAVIERAIMPAGSGDNVSVGVDAIPVLRVEAPAGMSFTCVDAMLASVQRAGFPKVILAPAGGGEAELASFPLTDIGGPPPTVIVRVGAGGRMTWNGEAVDAAGLTERASRMGGLAGTPLPPGELEIRPARDASFGAVHAAVSAAREGNVLATLLPPSVDARPAPPRPAVPSPPPPVAGAP
jgi:hypothetical protein